MSVNPAECIRCGRSVAGYRRKTRNAFACRPCSELINRQIERLVDADEIEIGDGPRYAAELGLTHDTFLQRVSRIRRKQRELGEMP